MKKNAIFLALMVGVFAFSWYIDDGRVAVDRCFFMALAYFGTEFVDWIVR